MKENFEYETDEPFYVLTCPHCKGKCGMRIDDELKAYYKEIGAKVACRYCGVPYLIDEPNLCLGIPDDVVSRHSKV